jgi:raffinose/stachyose/melibiose transport system substrate-binding protein
MRSFSLTRRTALAVSAAIALMTTSGAAMAESVIHWLHLEAVPEIVEVWRGIADDYEKANPGVKIEMQFIANQDFKAKLPTLLQSNEAPSFFYSWSGGVLKAQSETGALRDVTEVLNNHPEWMKEIMPSAIEGMTFDGKVWGVPYKTGNVSFFYNKALLAQAGVDPTAIKTWDDFLAAVQKLKDAGITPLAGGGADKWPIHFYWSYLAMREAGEAGFAAAKAQDGDGFMNAAFIHAGEKLAALGAMEPFQPGYLAAKWNDSLGAFADGKTAMILGFENNNLSQANAATDNEGLADDNLGRFDFPVIDGAPGLHTDYLGRLNGWAVTKDAPPETEDFLMYLSSPDIQRVLAEKTLILPVARSAADGVTNALVKESADALANETWHQNFLDQDLGPNVGAVVNDMSIEIVTGQMAPEDATQQIQDAYALEN